MGSKDIGQIPMLGPTMVVGTQNHSPSSSTSHANGDPSLQYGTPRRLERGHSNGGKLRAGGQPSHKTHESRTVGEYALHQLFTEFEYLADQKFAQCLNSNRPEVRTEQICGPGVDPALDQLISALGHIARQKPKPLIDTLMCWRKVKSDLAQDARDRLLQSRQQASSTTSLPNIPVSSESTLALHRADMLASRRSTISIYLLCRVLMEVFRQSTLMAVTPDVADKLEGIIYGQLSSADPIELGESPFRQSNWIMFSQLLGKMSEMDFDRVVPRFLNDLNRMQLSAERREDGRDGRATLVIRGMRYIKLKYKPESVWDRTSDFLLALAQIFATASGQNVKYAFVDMLKELLLPIAAGATSELNVPKWAGVIGLIKPRLTTMLVKTRHWPTVFPSLVVVLCASPTEAFSSQWLTLITPLATKLKESANRAAALRGICRLVWTYIFRTPDSFNNATRNLTDHVIKLVFSSTGKKAPHITTDPDVADPLIQLIRIIGFKYRDLCMRSIIWPLMNPDMFSSGREVRIQDVEPEKTVIAIRAFLAIMTDQEKGEQPPFPVDFDSYPHAENFRSHNSRSPMHAFSKSTLWREERLSRPVVVTNFDKQSMGDYAKFCKVLGEITIFCDNTFGGQAVLDEKFSHIPKTPIAEAFSFARRDESQSQTDVRQTFYDLLHVAVQALPRCLSPHISFNPLVNLLCTGTAHVQSTIAASSVQSLKSIAKQGHAQQVTVGFARFIFNYDDRYSTMSDGGMLGTGHIESTLKLYVELLQIWIEEIKLKPKRAAVDFPGDTLPGHRGAHLDFSSLWAHVDEVESHGLFFLCSPSRRVRSFAVTVLRLVLEFDTALGKDSQRVIQIMEGKAELVLDADDEKLSVAERSRVQKLLKRKGEQSAVVELCSSDAAYDSTLWFKIFPNLIRLSAELCPTSATITRNIVCARISQMHRAISSLADGPRPAAQYALPGDGAAMRGGTRLASTQPDMLIEQWKLYLIFACTTLTKTSSEPQLPQLPGHVRKSSKNPPHPSDKIESARELFVKIIPLLGVQNHTIRSAVVLGLGSVNLNLYRALLEALQPAVHNCNEAARNLMNISNTNRSLGSPRRFRHSMTDYLRTEMAGVYKLTSHFLKLPEVYSDEWILANLVNYTQDLRLFLNDADVQLEWEFIKLRTNYCGLMEELFEGLKKTKDPSRWMPFQARKAAFGLMEEWCGFSPNEPQIQQREAKMRQSLVEEEQVMGKPGSMSVAMEHEKKDLKMAALSAMATLCGGPVSLTNDNRPQAHLSFDVLRLIDWIDRIFNNVSDKTQAIGRRALKNLIVHNREHTYFLSRCLEICYLCPSAKALECYFEVVTQIMTERDDIEPEFWKVISACLFTLGSESNQLRMKSAKLLRFIEERKQKSSKLHELDIKISDKTIGVYKQAQFDMSQRLAQQHPELAFHVFSEFSKYFKDLEKDRQRVMVAAMLPWVQQIELKLDPNGGPTPSSYMVLINLFEITVRFGSSLYNEIEGFWGALTSHPGNVQLIIDFVMELCLEKRDQNIVDHTRQIVVYIAKAVARSKSKVIEYLLLHITPKAMVRDKDQRQSFITLPQETTEFPYLADLNIIFSSGPMMSRQQRLSQGQLALILLVDLIVTPTELAPEFVPLLLQVVLVLWDHYVPRVQEGAREMLVHLIHELVLSKMDDISSDIGKERIEQFIDMIRREDPKVVWTFDDFNGKDDSDGSLRVPENMVFVATEVVDIFSIAYPTIREDLGKTMLKWASSCPVHHQACRSFQVFRCILSSLEQPMLADMLGRLSNTIADEVLDVQSFSMEILTTLKTIIGAFAPIDLIEYPQLFWTICACLDTVHEREFMESLVMLERTLEKLDLADPATVQSLIENKPPKWEGSFDGLLSLVYKGVRSSVCLEKSLTVMEKLVLLPPGDLVGDVTTLVFVILANCPSFLHAMENKTADPKVYGTAERLSKVAEQRGYIDIAACLGGFVGRLFRTSGDFFSHLVTAIKPAFFPELEFNCLVFIMSLLTNKKPWFKNKVMEMLCVLIPEIDMKKTEISSKGPDLITPLLRLLQTVHCPQALTVLDNVVGMNATPLDNKHLRMSMMGANSDRAKRKEYEKTQSLYGIPADSGWAIPMPAIHSATTRSNVHAVFYTCASTDVPVVVHDATPKIELVDDEFGSTYFPDYRTATMMSDDTRDEAMPPGQLDLTSRLESLDDFFDDDEDMDAEPGPLPNAGKYSTTTVDSREHLYEQQIYPMLQKSLTRNASVSSLQTGFSDGLRVSPSREPIVMTPTAFMHMNDSSSTLLGSGTRTNSTSSTATITQGSVIAQLRPALHTRSQTSPNTTGNAFAQNSDLLMSPPGTAISTDSFLDDLGFLSDDDGSLPSGRPSGDKRPAGWERTALDSDLRPYQNQNSHHQVYLPGNGSVQQLSAQFPPLTTSHSYNNFPSSPHSASTTSLNTYGQGHSTPHIQRPSGLRSGFRSGIRRLTGGGGDAKESAQRREMIRRDLHERSPQVPKVPDHYLSVNPKSADL
jgi:hypothetical protein